MTRTVAPDETVTEMATVRATETTTGIVTVIENVVVTEGLMMLLGSMTAMGAVVEIMEASTTTEHSTGATTEPEEDMIVMTIVTVATTRGMNDTMATTRTTAVEEGTLTIVLGAVALPGNTMAVGEKEGKPSRL